MPLKLQFSDTLTPDNFFSTKEFYQAHVFGSRENNGKATREDVDLIGDHPELTRIAVSGLDDDLFEYFTKTYGSRFEAIHLCFNEKIEDLSPLGSLDSLEILSIYVNNRAEKLWDMSGNKKLKMLGLHDFTRLRSLSGVETAPALECLAFGGLIWPSRNNYSVPVLENTNLKSVMFSAAVDMESVLKFLSVDGIQRLDFECNRYPTEFLAWICANYPWVEGYCLKPYLKFEDSAIVCGKRKKTLRGLKDQKTRRALDNVAEQFENMKRRFTGMTFEELKNIIK